MIRIVRSIGLSVSGAFLAASPMYYIHQEYQWRREAPQRFQNYVWALQDAVNDVIYHCNKKEAPKLPT